MHERQQLCTWTDFDEEHGKPSTIQTLVERYYASPRFQQLSLVTQGNYRGVFRRFCREHGHRPLAGLTRQRLTQIVDGMADRPGAALVLVKRLRTLSRFAVDMGWVQTDPTSGIRAVGSGGFHTWTEAEIAQFEAHWPVGSRRRLAFALHLHTGQRRSDVHRLGWADLSGGAIRMTQQKTGTRLAIAVHPALAAILAAATRSGPTMLMTEFGRSFTVAGYGMWMSRAIRAAGLPKRCVTHGLRKAAARRLAEAGCSAHEIMAMTGHRSLVEAERYTRAADQERLARQAVAKLVQSSEPS